MRVIATGALCTACGGAMTPEFSVELDLFSGRPNPAWTLTAPQARELARLLDDLPPTDRRADPPGLGYRGFAVTGTLDCTVYAGIVTFPKGRRAEDAHGAERWLTDLARARGWEIPR
ncbi:hypothetical protein IU433_28400 [Nocardia puris]|uniref:hypothetical protein n=1 Tax=Nocardia puris TaxID=208602 RepID=UPI000831AD7E|nr:hypothetical protein [Nocardia puris]MBF6213693.1 hypothetical protein [Nocardia puris]MBF6368356.1 hypothetical protein [Nocardia puris]MBF6462931.1 hypothetical protein [Nocardia puris]